MKTLLLLDKKAGLLRLVQLFKEKDELNIKDIKRKIPSTSYYRDVLARLVEINEILEEVDLEYFVKPIFIKEDGRMAL